MLRRLLVVVVALVSGAACSDDGGDEDSGARSPSDSGCPVEPDDVADALGVEVRVDDDVRSTSRSCEYRGAGGARVAVEIRPFGDEETDDDTFDDLRAEVQARAGLTVDLPDGLVDGAEAGWVATVGRSVQVAAVRDERLVIVAVTDPLREAGEAREVAADLADEAL